MTTRLLTLAAAAVTALAVQLPAQADQSERPDPLTVKATSATGKGDHPVSRSCAVPRRAGEMGCKSMVRDDVKIPKAQLAAAAEPTGLGPADLRSAYTLPSGTDADGRTVAIVDAFDNPDAEAELAAYRGKFGLPPCTSANGCFKKVDQRGGTDYPAHNSGWAGEISLDVQMVSAVCPGCRILLVEADSNSVDSLGTAVNQAVAMGAKYVSNSWGGDEGSYQLAADAQYFDHPGVAVTASSGDNGYGTSYPAASPNVTAVGGTSLVKDSSARGWSESAWSGAGSGCSAYAPKPSAQQDSGCAKRTVADVSAVADPNTGVSVFFEGAWRVFGGTSVSAPIIASAYALGGAPVAGSQPSTYPYARASKLNDVTSGSNGSCSGSYLCTAKEGYDGPTGLGTPSGIEAFSAGPHATVRGKVTDAADGKPLTGAEVSAGDFATTTDERGTYELVVPPGAYIVKVAKFGYATKSFPEATLADGRSVTDDAGLTPKPRVAVSGTVADDSGHGWPLYAQVSVKGEPTSVVHNDPATGHYTIDLPEDGTYTLQTDAAYPGYRQSRTDVTVAATDRTQNLGVKVEDASCTAAGYAHTYHGDQQDFETADGATTPPAGWTVTDGIGNGQTWKFNSSRDNDTGGSGKFAMVDSDRYGGTGQQNTSLVSPVWDFSADTHPILTFNSDYHSYSNGSADVDLSIDGGATWQNLTHWTTAPRIGPSPETVDLATAAGKSQVQVRFHYTGKFAYYWAVDDVFAGDRTCDPKSAGLVVGQVTDKNTDDGVAGATVTSDDKPGDGAVTVATPDDAALGDGFYWFVSTLTGTHPVTARGPGYTAEKNDVAIAADAATTADYTLSAGRLEITPPAVDKTVAWQGTGTATVTLKNTGTADAHVELTERPGGFDLQKTGAGAAPQDIKGTYTPEFIAPGRDADKADASTEPAAAPWTGITDYRVPIMDNAVATGDDGKVYSVGGISGSAVASNTYVYDPAVAAWSLAKDSGQRREAAQAAFLGGKLYVTGGWSNEGTPLNRTQAYDPGAGTWSDVASSPKGLAGAASATLEGKWYVVGGCTDDCGATTAQAFDPDAGTWTTLAPYPIPVSWLGCGGIAGRLYCAGGTTSDSSTTKGYVYDPTDDTWSPIAEMPIDLWASGYTAAGGKLMLSGGVTTGTSLVTNRGLAYDPLTNSWSDLPNSNNALYRGGSSCGFYKVGGSGDGFSPSSLAEQLPGLGSCTSSSDVDWLSVDDKELTVAPGTSKTVTVTLDAQADSVSQPGAYKGQFSVGEDTPYSYAPIGVAVTVSPPGSWGKITGTVEGAACDGDQAALKGATIVVKSASGNHTLKTDADGRFALWLDARSSPLEVIAAKDGWTPDSRNIKIKRGDTSTADYTLQPDHSCG
ncbi:carboxypeptidase regulatory-like domain-containing protein [Streptomyces sp. NBC_00063]|uniref:carboxypeptidase regulatory-like domain-containing protein n=1 Tax=Streptomyces sp. NBC_00063 TaxID=2975638 RepID=UPI003D712925